MRSRNRGESGLIVAVEISARELRVLKLRRGKPAPVIEAYERCALPADHGRERRDAIVANLRRLLASAREGDAEVRLAFDHPAMLLRNLRFPAMPKSEIADAVKYHWTELTQAPLERMAYDLVVYEGRERRGRSAPDHHAGSEVVVAAAPVEELEGLLTLFKEAGARPAAVIPAAVALHAARQFELRKSDATRGPEVILEIGASRTSVLLVQGARILMSREIPTGGDTFTNTLQSELDSGRDEAEKLKCLYGMSTAAGGPSGELAGDPGGALDPSTARSILFALRPVAERLAGEIQRTVAYAQEQFGTGPVEKVLLTGGGARLRGLDQMIGEALGAATAIWRPSLPGGTRHSDGEGKGAGAISAVCLGAAARPPAMDFLSPSKLASPKRSASGTTLWLAASYVLALVAIVGWHWWSDRQLAARLGAGESRLAELAPAEGGLRTLAAYVADHGLSTLNFSAVFSELDGLAPAGVVFEELALVPPAPNAASSTRRNRVLRIEGTALGATTAAEANLARFLDSVEASPFFQNIQLVRSRTLQKPDESGLRFAFTSEVEPAGLFEVTGGRSGIVPRRGP